MDRHFRTSLNKDDMYGKQRSSQKPAHDLHFRRKNLSPNKEESSRRGYSGFTNSSSEDKSFRSSQEKRNETRSSIPTEAKSQVPKNLADFLRSDPYFLHELHALPTEVFLKLVLLKLDKMEIDGFAELSELAKFINKGKEVVSKSLPPDIETVVKQMMLDKTGMNPATPVTQPVNTQVSPFDKERKAQPQGTNYSLITDLLNQAKRECLPSASAAATVGSHQYESSNASYQNPQSYPGLSHGQVNFPYPSTYTPSSNESLPYNTASSNMSPAKESFAYNTASSNIPPVNESFAYNFASPSMTSVIPGLTLNEEQRESYSAYNAYQSQNSQPSAPNYNNFRY